MKEIYGAIPTSGHLSLKSKLRSFLDGKEKLETKDIPSYRRCGLGRWIHFDDIGDVGPLPEMVELVKAHIELHSIAKRVIELKNAGESSCSEDEFRRFGAVSRKITELLADIEMIADIEKKASFANHRKERWLHVDKA